ncbi:MAG: NfeD family protein [Thermodesulfobacteriota bacterium]|nr:NfeD family protein [Thermodesulfobacteriota bacterium]
MNRMARGFAHILARTCLSGLILLSATFILHAAENDKASPYTVYTVKISGEVAPGMLAYVKRALSEIPDDASLIVMEMDTFGGRVDSALMIVDQIVNAAPETMAFVTRKAISAGALIALSCDTLAMRPATTIGDCAPITFGNEGPQMLGEKFQSPLRAKFRSLAKKNGYSEVLAESMVTAEMEVYAITENNETRYVDAVTYSDFTEAEKATITAKKTVVAKGELLTMDNIEARDLGFSTRTANTVDELLAGRGIADYDIIPVKQAWSEGLMRFLGTFAPLLLIIGLGAIYTEIKAPGFGVPGIVGLIALFLFFMNQYTVGLADYTELLIVLLGLVLIGFEIFVIPGFGIAGIAGILCLVIGFVLSLQGFVIPDPAMPWQMDLLVWNLVQVLGAVLAAFLISMFMLRYVLPRFSRVVEGPYLDTTLREFHADSIEALTAAIGDIGLARTDLRPAGKALINNRVYDVVTEGQFLEKETPVVVSAIRGNILVVSEKEAKS